MGLFDRKGRLTRKALDIRATMGFGNLVILSLQEGVRGSRQERDRICDLGIGWLAECDSVPDTRTNAYQYALDRFNDLWVYHDVAKVIADLEAYLLRTFPTEPPIMKDGGPITIFTMALIEAFTAEVRADGIPAVLGERRREHVIDQAARALATVGLLDRSA